MAGASSAVQSRRLGLATHPLLLHQGGRATGSRRSADPVRLRLHDHLRGGAIAMTDEQEWEELPLEGYPGEILKVRATTRWERAAEARYELKGKRITGLIRIEVERYQRDLFS